MNMLGGAIIGFLLGLIFCYWKQLNTAYQKRDLIGAAGDFATSGSNLYDHLRQSL